jgi:general secretion pathway protein M
MQALLLLLVAVVIVTLLVFIPWWNKNSFYDEQQQVLQSRLERYAAVISQKKMLSEQLAAAENQLKNSDVYFRAATAELAGAELQLRIKALVDSSGATLISTQNLGVSATSGPTTISVRVRLSGDIDSLARILYELETEKPVVIIENLSMRAKRVSSRRQRTRQVDHLVDLNFDLVGFLRMQNK